MRRGTFGKRYKRGMRRSKKASRKMRKYFTARGGIRL